MMIDKMIISVAVASVALLGVGNVISNVVAVPALSDLQRYELRHDTDTGRSFLGDGDFFTEVVLLTPAQYTILTGRLDRVWASLHSTEEGRVSMHGQRISTAVDETAHTKRSEYADGYVHTESLKVARKQPTTARTDPNATKNDAIRSRQRARMSARQAEVHEAQLRALSGTPRIVTVEHDATTGKDKEVNK